MIGRRAGLWIVVPSIAVMVLAGCSGTDSSSTVVATTGGVANGDSAASEAPGAASNPIGATQEIVDGDVTTRVTVENLVPGQPSEYGMSATGDLQQVTVTIQGVEGTTNANPLYFTARAADGTSYDAALASVDGELTTATVAAGDVLKGIVAFDVTGAPIASIRYNGALMDELAQWVVQ